MYGNNNLPNDPSVAGRVGMDHIYGNAPQGLNMYTPNQNSPLLGSTQPSQGPSQFNTGFNTHQHPRDLSIPTKMSDELPYERGVDNYKNIVRRKRYTISSLHRVQGNHWDFSIDTQESLKDIRYIRLIKGTINYTVPATPILNSYVLFPDFTNAESLSNNKEYHGFIPVIQGSTGSNVLFSYVFSEDYITEFKNLDTVKNRLRIQVFKENSSTGAIESFDDLNSYAIEVEFGYIDQAYKLEQQINR